MAIGTSLGGFFQSEMEMHVAPYQTDKDLGIQPKTNLDTNDDNELPGNPGSASKFEVKDQMPFPDNKDYSTDFVNRFPKDIKSGILNDIKPQNPDQNMPLVRKIGWQNNSEEFSNLPDTQYIQNIDKNPGFFFKEDAQVQPLKKYSDRAKDLTMQTYNLYKSGDADTVKAVQDWEDQTIGRGYNDTDVGKQLRQEAFDKYASKTTMSKDALWETYMKHMQDLAGADAEDEKHSPQMRENLQNFSKFDRIGRPQIDFKKHWADGKFK